MSKILATANFEAVLGGKLKSFSIGDEVTEKQANECELFEKRLVGLQKAKVGQKIKGGNDV